MSNLVNVRDYFNLVVANDWGPAFAAAIVEAVGTRRGGVFVPADGTDYTVKKPAPGVPSIDLRGLRNFALLGEGDGSRIQLLGSGLRGSWNMIMVGGNCVDVTIRNLYLDGDRSHLTQLDPGQHTHTIQVGGMKAGGSARRVRILDCTMTDMDGDGVAIAALAGPFGGGNDVSVVDIIGCKFLDCGRSGVSNQRSAEFVRIHQCHFEGTSDQDIDFEPTGAELASGPRRYSIIGNTMIHSGGAASVTLSGVGGDIPARDNIFAYNQIYGGRVGMLDTEHVLIVGNYVEGSLIDTGPVLQLRGKSEGARISQNHLVRPPGSLPGKALNISSRALIFTLRGIDHTTDTLIVPAHGRDTGTGPVTLTTRGTLPTGLTLATNYWLIRVDADTLKLAVSEANAIAGAAVAFSDNGTGDQTVKFPASVTLKGFDHTTDTVTVPSHARDTGTGPVTLTTTGTLPTGLTLATNYWLIRVDADTLKLAVSEANANAGTAVAFADNGTGRHALVLVDRPSGVDVSQNRLHSHSSADEDGCTVLITNAQRCSFTENEVASYAGATVPTGVRFATSAAIRTPVDDWSICQNRIRGNAGHDGTYDNGVTLAPIGVPVRGLSLNGNTFRGCTNQIRWSVGTAGSYADIPTVYGNLGDGNDFAELGNVSAVCISGNAASQADYAYSANTAPTFNAADGSTARRRTGGTTGATIYFREAGGWVAK